MLSDFIGFAGEKYKRFHRLGESKSARCTNVSDQFLLINDANQITHIAEAQCIAKYNNKINWE